MAVGFPGLHDLNKRTVRAAINPMDRATVISIFPFLVDDTKPTTIPSRYTIQPGSFDKPSILIVGPASWWREIDAQQPLLEITNSSIQVADSIVKDYCNGMLEYDPNTNCSPGLSYVNGCKFNKESIVDEKATLEWIKIEYRELLNRMNQNQKNWYQAIVRRADVDWSRTNGNPLAISSIARYAARELGLEKEWLKDFQAVQLVRCFACGAMKNPNYPICQTCKSVDPSHPKARDVKVAV